MSAPPMGTDAYGIVMGMRIAEDTCPMAAILPTRTQPSTVSHSANSSHSVSTTRSIIPRCLPPESLPIRAVMRMCASSCTA